MFTGLVEETGVVKSLRRRRKGLVLRIVGRKTRRGLAVNDSIAVEGVCLTVTRTGLSYFEVQAVEETLAKTTLKRLNEGDRVNLERPIMMSSRLGGHFVLGHVDGTGRVDNVETRKSSLVFWIRVPQRFTHHLIPVGSIAVNGVSLTMARVQTHRFAVSIIPHTLKLTTLKSLKKGDAVNLEFDVLGKFVERFMKRRRG